MKTLKDYIPYDPSTLSPGVVHIGLGNFSRAFLGEYFHDVAANQNRGWGIIGVKPTTEEVDPELKRQDFIYALITQNGEEVCTPIGVLRGIIPGKNNSRAVIEQIMAATTKLVTLTVTGDGYCLDAHSQPDIARVSADLVALKRGDWAHVTTIPGWITAALFERYQQGSAPFTVLSCDNLPRNGDLTRYIINSMAQHLEAPGFVDYVQTECAFPNSVVDRIVPTQDREANARHVEARWGHRDANPLWCESSKYWFIEDKFTETGRPPLEEAGALFVPSTEPYERLKIHSVNGSHLALATMAKVLEITYIHEAMADKSLASFIEHYLREVALSLQQEVGFDLEEYRADVISRLSNERMPDEIDRMLKDTKSKVVPRLVNREALERGHSTDASAFGVAAWLFYLRGRDQSQNAYGLHFMDRNQNPVHNLKDPSALASFIEKQDAFSDRASLTQFSEQVFRHLDGIERKGIRAALDEHFAPLTQVRAMRPVAKVRTRIPAVAGLSALNVASG